MNQIEFQAELKAAQKLVTDAAMRGSMENRVAVAGPVQVTSVRNGTPGSRAIRLTYKINGKRATAEQVAAFAI